VRIYSKINQYLVLINAFNKIKGLSSSFLHTSMKKVEGSGANWLGDLASALIPPKDPAKDGDCMGLSSIGLSGLNCDTISNFVCQAPDPPGGASKTPSMK